jgi:hypothetical protein
MRGSEHQEHKKITTELDIWLNKAVNYQEKEVSWNYVIF